MATNLTHLEIEEKLILKEIAKLLTSRRRLWFLSECLRNNLTPNTLKVLPPNRNASFSDKNTQNTYKNAAISASRKNLQIAVKDAKRQEQKQSNYFEIQAQHQWKNFAQFIKNNKIKIANKIKARYMKKLLFLKRKENVDDKNPKDNFGLTPFQIAAISENNLPKPNKQNESISKKKIRRFMRRSKFLKMKKVQSRKKINLIHNLSTFHLTKPMEDLLN